MTSYCYPVCSDTKILPVCVCAVGVRELEKSLERIAGYPYHQLFICAEGSGKVVISQKRTNVRAGDMIFIPALVPHQLVPSEGKWQLIGVDLDGNSIDNILETLRLTKPRCEKLSDHETLVRKMLAIIHAVKEEGDAVISDCSALAYDLLMQLNKQINVTAENADGQKFIQIAPVIAFIEENYQSELSLDNLSALVNISPQYLCRLFKDCYHMRPFEYLAKKRLQRAKVMLTGEKYSVNEIAQLVGYNDCSYFCSVFKKREGISPAEFRALNCPQEKKPDS